MGIREVTDFLVAFTNTSFVAGGVFFCAYLARWAFQRDRSVLYVLTCFTLIVVAVTIRVGFWWVATLEGTDVIYMRCSMDMLSCKVAQDNYPLWAIQWRGVLVFSAVMFITGISMFIRYIEEYTHRWKVKSVAGLITLSTVVSFIPLLRNL